jgi:GntR family transcriptional regulator, vanillate catabolism transcriptional regulator
MKEAAKGGQTQTLKAVLGLRDLVLGGSFEPGERLSEVVLSERLGISRTPLRSALQRLEQEGLVELIPTGGYAVRSFSHADVVDSIELRGVLEGTAARLAAERGVSAAKMRDVEQILHALDLAIGKGSDDLIFEQYVDLNAQFHLQISELSGSAVIAREIARVTQLPFASPSAFLEHQATLPVFRQSLVIGQSHHRGIVLAIANRQGTRAETLAREHASLAHQNLERATRSDRGPVRMPALALVAI